MGDTDGDELVDGFEKTEQSSSKLGSEFQTDPELADTDGDGLADGEEVTAEFDGVTWEIESARSDPTAADSDGDGLDDAAEREVGTDPLSADSDDDGVGDDLELTLGTDPLDADTDGDGMDDGSDPAPLTEGDGSPDTTLAEETAGAGDALYEGASRGQVGMPDGAEPSEHSDSPFYVAGWLGASFVPVGGTGADARDAAQNVANGNWVDAGLDGIGLIPVVGDGVKGLAKIKDWLKTFKGRSDELLQTLRATGFMDRIPAAQQEEIIEATGKERPYRAATDGGKNLPPIGPNIKQANNMQAGKLEDGKRFTKFDVAKRGKDPDTGDAIILMDTPKWDSTNTIPQQTIGFRHIIARHGHPNTNHPDAFRRTDGYDVHAGKTAREGSGPTTSLFPKDMTPEEIQVLVMEAATSPNRQVVENRGRYETLYKYDVPKSYPYAVDEVEVLIRDKSGMIKSAHPEGIKSPTIPNK